jgi:methylenetetrahydrofolate reductase (NADPH)
MLNKMNQGFDPKDGKKQQLSKTNFCIGAVTTNFKLREGEVMPQYFKLQKKVECGAQFIINQIGFDSRKISELRLYMDNYAMKQVPLIGNVYLLGARVAQLFSEGRIPGIVLTKPLLDLCQKHGQDTDGGKAFFYEFAAKQMAIYRGLGFRGVYLGGVHNFPAIQKILEIERTFKPDDWKQFACEINYSRPDEYFFYGRNPATGLADAAGADATVEPTHSKHHSLLYQVSKWSHDTMFSSGTAITRLGAKICANSKDPMQGPKPMRLMEHVSKAVLFQCKDCGDCSLPDIAFLCPESQCAKNQRNGPCGGTREGRCEVDGYGDCIWLRAYERLRHEGRELDLLKHAPVVQNQGLRGTSAWANFWLGRDHAAKQANAAAKTPGVDQQQKASTEKQPSPKPA